MKKFTAFIAIALMIVIGYTQTSCIGSFKLTNKVLEWNKSLGNKFVNELVFLVFVVVPVYEISILIDGLVLNTLEFWTGSNPMAMNPGEHETKIVEQNGIKYQITASQNRFDFTQLEGPQKGTSGALVYNPTSKSWSYEGANQSIKLVELTKNGTANVFLPKGKSFNVDVNQNGVAALKAIVNSRTLVAEK